MWKRWVQKFGDRYEGLTRKRKINFIHWYFYLKSK